MRWSHFLQLNFMNSFNASLHLNPKSDFNIKINNLVAGYMQQGGLALHSSCYLNCCVSIKTLLSHSQKDLQGTDEIRTHDLLFTRQAL